MNDLSYFSPAVDSAARALEMLSRYKSRSCTLTELSTNLAISKTTCLRVMKTLVAHGLVDYDEATKKYCLGYFAVVLGARAEEGLDTFNRVRPLMAEITDRSGLTTALVKRVSVERMMYVAKLDGVAMGNVNVSVGNRFPLFEVSYGKWVMAFSSEVERRELFPDKLPAVTPDTNTDLTAYRREIQKLGPHSIIESRGEYVLGVYAISFPVVDARGELDGVVVALGFSEGVSDADAERLRILMVNSSRKCNGHISFDDRGKR